jgi:16S rRNA (uracil1498-N3)-methyltransferase
MQQYFCEEPIRVGEDYILDREHAHHAEVVRLDHERVRLVYNGEGFFGECSKENGRYLVHVQEKDTRINEPGTCITLAPALIRKEKFELVLQKAAELGVSRIVPFESSRCVVHVKKEKGDKQLSRWQDIVREAAQQCKRNVIPEVCDVCSVKDLSSYQSEINVAPYENAYGSSRYLSDVFDGKKSITIVIGPEGGFSEEEMKQLKEMGYEAVTLGSRILRAETASLYAAAVCSEIAERNHE